MAQRTGITVERSPIGGGGTWERRDDGGEVVEHGKWWTNAFGEHIVRWQFPVEDSTGVTQAERESREGAPTRRIALARTVARRAARLEAASRKQAATWYRCPCGATESDRRGATCRFCGSDVGRRVVDVVDPEDSEADADHGELTYLGSGEAAGHTLRAMLEAVDGPESAAAFAADVRRTNAIRAEAEARREPADRRAAEQRHERQVREQLATTVSELRSDPEHECDVAYTGRDYVCRSCGANYGSGSPPIAGGGPELDEPLRITFRMETTVVLNGPAEGENYRTPLAVIEDAPVSQPGRVVVYAHLGQHSEADRDYVEGLPFATPEESADLREELRSIYGPDAVFDVQPPAGGHRGDWECEICGDEVPEPEPDIVAALCSRCKAEGAAAALRRTVGKRSTWGPLTGLVSADAAFGMGRVFHSTFELDWRAYAATCDEVHRCSSLCETGNEAMLDQVLGTATMWPVLTHLYRGGGRMWCNVLDVGQRKRYVDAPNVNDVDCGQCLEASGLMRAGQRVGWPPISGGSEDYPARSTSCASCGRMDTGAELCTECRETNSDAFTHGVLGYAADADVHCPACTVSRYGSLEVGTEDHEGNEIAAVNLFTEWWSHDADTPLALLTCGQCGLVIDGHWTIEHLVEVREAIAGELVSILADTPAEDVGDEGLDVRVYLRPDLTTLDVAYGDASFDTDHRGWCGASASDATATIEETRVTADDVLKDALETALDALMDTMPHDRLHLDV